MNFVNEYREHVEIRDNNLLNHLHKNPILFRTFIPYNSNLLHTLSQVVWYYDEVIVPDPFKRILDKKEWNVLDIQTDKKYIHDVIQYLKRFKDSIEEGFVLLCSKKAFPVFDKKIQQNESYLNLLEDKEVLAELERLVDIGIQRLDGENINGVIVRHRGNMSMKYGPNTKTWEISFVHRNEKGTPEDLEKLGMRGLLEGEIKKTFIYDIGEIASNLVIAENFNSHAMYSRNVDEVVLKKLNKQINSYKNDYNSTAFKVTLPFVNGIPTETLVDLRMKMPSIFEDFRHYMAELVLKIQEEENGNIELVNYKVKSEINKQLLKFEKEQKIALQKTRIIGLGTPLLSLAGTFAIQTFGLDINNLVLLSGGVLSATELNTLYSYLKNKEEAKTNSLYYLWKVNKKKK